MTETGAPKPDLLAGKVALVTGAARGIGLAVARAFAAAGAEVAVVDIDPARTQEAAAGLGPGARAFALDVTDADATERVLDEVAAAFGRLDIAVANAGILELMPALDMPVATFRKVLDVNLTGTFITATAAARRLVAQGQGGRIIVTSSLFGLRGGRENAAYSASKFGAIGLVQSMAAELAPRRITVNAVCPGQIRTEMMEKLAQDRAALTGASPEAVLGTLTARIPAGRLGDMDELAGTYVFLASDLAGYTTGQSLVVDGGWQVG